MFEDDPAKIWYFHNSFSTALVEGGWPWLLLLLGITIVVALRPFGHDLDKREVIVQAAAVAMLICAWKLGEVLFTLQWGTAHRHRSAGTSGSEDSRNGTLRRCPGRGGAQMTTETSTRSRRFLELDGLRGGIAAVVVVGSHLTSGYDSKYPGGEHPVRGPRMGGRLRSAAVLLHLGVRDPDERAACEVVERLRHLPLLPSLPGLLARGDGEHHRVDPVPGAAHGCRVDGSTAELHDGAAADPRPPTSTRCTGRSRSRCSSTP